MSVSSTTVRASLLECVRVRIREATHGRIRDLVVEDVGGVVVVRGLAPSHHLKQLALQGALELLSGDRFRTHINVG